MLDPRIKIRHIQAFLEASRLGHVGRAAERLHVTQPAVSKTIHELEASLGVRLFERKGRSLALTAIGRLFQHYAQAGMASLGQAVDSVALGRVPGETMVKVGALPTVAARLIPPAIALLLSERPEANVELLHGQNRFLYERLRSREIDLVVGRPADLDQMTGLGFEQIYSERVTMVVRKNHPLLSQHPLDPKAILTYRVIMPSAEDIIRPSVDRFLLKHGIAALKRRIETVSSEFCRNFLPISDAVWIISQGVVALDLEQGTLAALPLDLEETAGPVGMTVRANEIPSPITLAFMNAIRSAAHRMRQASN